MSEPASKEVAEEESKTSGLDDILNNLADLPDHLPNSSGEVLELSDGEHDAVPSKELPRKNKRKQVLGRRNIRHIMGEEALGEDVKAAQQAEQDRLKRISEKEKSDQDATIKMLLMENGESCSSEASLSSEGMGPPAPKVPRTTPLPSVAKRLASLLPPAPASVLPPSSARLSGADPARDITASALLMRKKIESQWTAAVDAARGLGKTPPTAGQTMEDAILLPDSDEDEEDFEEEDEDMRITQHYVQPEDEYREVIELSDGEDEEEVDDEAKEDAANTPDYKGRYLINRAHPPAEPDFFLGPQITKAIKPHQVSGICFLYDNVVESIDQFDTGTGFGCILAHSMGLGKTIQVIGFLDILFRYVGAHSVLVIVPINTIQNWQAEFDMWLPVKPHSNDKKDSSPPSSDLPEPPDQKASPKDEKVDPMEGLEQQQEEEEQPEILYRPFKMHVIRDTLKTMEARHQVVNAWRTQGGVLLIGYEMFRLLVGRRLPAKRQPPGAGTDKKKPILIDIDEEEKRANMWADFHAALVNPGPQVVICDEGHRIKNSEACISKALKAIKTHRRVVMTGYPLQNNLIEYWCMVDFVRPNYLGTKHNFTNMFQRPIENGQCVDSTQADRKLMQGRAHVLHELLGGFVQRRSHAVLQHNLPPKREFVILVKMTPIQRVLYSAFMDSISGKGLYSCATVSTLKTYAVCCKIWNHPDILWRVMQEQKTGDTFDFDIDDSTPSLATTNGGKTKAKSKAKRKAIGTSAASSPASSMPSSVASSMNNLVGASMPSSVASSMNNLVGASMPSSVASSMNNLNILDNDASAPQNGGGDNLADNPYVAAYMAQNDTGISYEWAVSEYWQNYEAGLASNGGKVVIFLSILNDSVAAGDKVLVFSQSLLTLDLLEDTLRRIPISPESGEKWMKNVSYYRLDGSTSTSERERLINNFNEPMGRAKLFLLSTRAGCLGVNLVGANRVVVFDASWNPCHDCQAVCRVYRYGQTKQCFIYRLVTDNTMEKKIYDRQVTKQGMSDRVVDELNPDQQFTRQQVEQLMDYEDKDLPSLSEENLEKVKEMEDDVLVSVLMKNSHVVTMIPFTHESLLIDRKDYRLTRAEKLIAKQRYEEEKRQSMMNQRPNYVDFYPRSGPDYGNPLIDPRVGMVHGRPIVPRPPIGGGVMARNQRSVLHPDLVKQYERQARLAAFTRQMEEARIRCGIRKETPGVFPIAVPLNRPAPGLPLATRPRLAAPSAVSGQRLGAPSAPGKGISPSLLEGKGCRINRIKATTDLFFPGTTTVTNSQRKIQKGEVMEVIQTTKGKYLRVPRTGDLYVVRTNPTSSASSSTSTTATTSTSISGASVTPVETIPVVSSISTTMSSTTSTIATSSVEQSLSASLPTTSAVAAINSIATVTHAVTTFATTVTGVVNTSAAATTASITTAAVTTAAATTAPITTASSANNTTFSTDIVPSSSVTPSVTSSDKKQTKAPTKKRSSPKKSAASKKKTDAEPMTIAPAATSVVSTAAPDVLDSNIVKNTTSTLDSIINLVAAGGGPQFLEVKEPPPPVTQSIPTVSVEESPAPSTAKPKKKAAPRNRKKQKPVESKDPVSNQSQQDGHPETQAIHQQQEPHQNKVSFQHQQLNDQQQNLQFQQMQQQMPPPPQPLTTQQLPPPQLPTPAQPMPQQQFPSMLQPPSGQTAFQQHPQQQTLSEQVPYQQPAQATMQQQQQQFFQQPSQQTHQQQPSQLATHQLPQQQNIQMQYQQQQFSQQHNFQPTQSTTAQQTYVQQPQQSIPPQQEPVQQTFQFQPMQQQQQQNQYQYGGATLPNQQQQYMQTPPTSFNNQSQFQPQQQPQQFAVPQQSYPQTQWQPTSCCGCVGVNNPACMCSCHTTTTTSYSGMRFTTAPFPSTSNSQYVADSVGTLPQTQDMNFISLASPTSGYQQQTYVQVPVSDSVPYADFLQLQTGPYPSMDTSGVSGDYQPSEAYNQQAFGAVYTAGPNPQDMHREFHFPEL